MVEASCKWLTNCLSCSETLAHNEIDFSRRFGKCVSLSSHSGIYSNVRVVDKLRIIYLYYIYYIHNFKAHYNASVYKHLDL